MPMPTRISALVLAAFTAAFSFLALAAPAAVADDTVTFADPALQACVNAALSQESTADVTAADAAGITSLTCADNAMTDLSGIEALSSLRELTILQQGQSTFLTSIEPLSALTSLETIGLSYTAVTDLTPIRELGALRTLSMQDSRAPLSDLTTVGSLTGLTTLRLSQVGTFDGERLAPLSALTSLETLQLNGGAVVDLGPLRPLAALVNLEMTSNAIVDLEPLTALTALKYVNLNSNSITDPSPLGEITGLLQVNLGGNLIADASGLSPLSAITYLTIDRNALVDLEFLEGWVTLRTLYAQNNQITDVTPLLDHTRLVSANLSGNQVVDASPLYGASEAARITLTGQRVTLADLPVGTAQDNPLIDVDGSAILPTSTTAVLDEAANSWTFTSAQRNTLTWSVPVLLPDGTDSGQIFSGTLTQLSIEELEVEAGALALTATASLAAGGTGDVGDEVEHTFSLTNTGDVTLTDVTLTDPLLGLSEPTISWPGEVGTLEVGARATATARYLLTAEDVAAGSVTSTATAVGRTPLGVAVTDSATASVALPAIVPPVPDPEPSPDPEPAPDPEPTPDVDPTPDPAPDVEPTEDPSTDPEPAVDPTAVPGTAATATPTTSSEVSGATDTTGPSTTSPSSTARLARTGTEASTVVFTGGLLLVTGATAAVLARTARRH